MLPGWYPFSTFVTTVIAAKTGSVVFLDLVFGFGVGGMVVPFGSVWDEGSGETYAT